MTAKVYHCAGCNHDSYFHVEDAPEPKAYSCQSCWTKIPFAEAEALDELKASYAEQDAEWQKEQDDLARLDREVNEEWHAVTTGGYDDEIPF